MPRVGALVEFALVKRLDVAKQSLTVGEIAVEKHFGEEQRQILVVFPPYLLRALDVDSLCVAHDVLVVLVELFTGDILGVEMLHQGMVEKRLTLIVHTLECRVFQVSRECFEVAAPEEVEHIFE